MPTAYDNVIHEDTQAPNDTQNADTSLKSPVGPIVLPPRDMPRDSKGHWLPGYKPTSAIASSEQGKQLATRRHELAAVSARQALAQRAEAEGLQRSPIAAYGLLAGLAYDASVANLMDKPREGVEAGKFALRLAHMLPEADKTANVAVGVQVILSPEGAVAASKQVLEWREDSG